MAVDPSRPAVVQNRDITVPIAAAILKQSLSVAIMARKSLHVASGRPPTVIAAKGERFSHIEAGPLI